MPVNLLEARQQVDDARIIEPVEVLVNGVDEVRQELAHQVVVFITEETLRNTDLDSANEVVKVVRSQLIYLHVLDVSHERLERLFVLR